jgi:hypothetical protein
VSGLIRCSLVLVGSLLALGTTLGAQEHSSPNQPTPESKTAVVSAQTSTARVADPNELIGISGHVMRVSEFVTFLSADTALVQRLRNLEKQNSEDSPQAAPQSENRRSLQKSISMI